METRKKTGKVQREQRRMMRERRREWREKNVEKEDTANHHKNKFHIEGEVTPWRCIDVE
jgi:hypothetical protein